MRGLRPLLIVLLATLFAASGLLRMTPSAGATPPCHAMAGMAGDERPAPSHHRSKSEMMAVNCCAGCLPAAVRDLAPIVRDIPATALSFAVLSQAVEDLALAPEPRPPRAFA